MKNLPFDKPGTFWRGNLHTHSTLSDGKMTPEQVCAQYRQAGYDFLSLTEHFLDRYGYPLVDTRPYRTDDFTTIIGAELHAGAIEVGTIWHILAVGLPLDFAQPSEGETGPDLARRALDAGAFVAAAHPQWYTLTPEDVVSLGPIHAIEVMNGVAVDDSDRFDSWHIADILLSRGYRYTACATDDYHAFPNRHDFARGWVWVKSESLEPGSLLDALKAGHYYSSTGPQIFDIKVNPGKEVIVKCSPVDRIFLLGRGPASRNLSEHGMTEAVFDISEFNSPYCRVTVRDAAGGRAWSNPLWFEPEGSTG